jgi:hypothetical protein
MESTHQSLRKFLGGSGWQTEDNVIWKRGDMRVALAMPTGWNLAKLDINAPRDFTEVANGASVAELEQCLKTN